MKVLLTVASLRPGYGGPALSVPNLAATLAALATEVGLWSPDGSAADTPVLAQDSPVLRLTGTPSEALARFGRPDILHDNGIWLPHNHRLAVLAKRQGLARVVSPRGMLAPWALAHKRLKKALAWRLYQHRDLRRANLLHASSPLEARQLEALALGPPVATIGMGVEMAPEAEVAQAWSARAEPGAGQPRTATFIGRLYPVKGLPMLLRAWAAVRPAGWRLVLAGPDEAGHRAELEALVRSLDLGEFVSLPGPVAGETKRRLLLASDLFVMPSHQESFGLAAAEALAHGVPVLATTATPWTALEEHGCGWLAEPETADLERALRDVTGQTPAALVARGRRGFAYAAEQLATDRHGRAMLAAYAQLLRGGACGPA